MKPEILYLYKGGRRSRLAQSAPFPSEFYYGLIELRQKGYGVDLTEQEDYPPFPAWLHKVFRRIMHALLPGFPGDLILVLMLLRPSFLKKMAQTRILVVTTQSLGLSLCLLHWLRLVPGQIVFIVMGALPKGTSGRAERFALKLMRQATLLSISQGERRFLQDRFGKSHDVGFLPFGVDTGFWSPETALMAADRPFVFSIGNDSNRDFVTLIDAWRPDFPELRIVTSLNISSSKENVRIIAGDWRRQTLDDADVRRLFRQSLFVILPIRETTQPAGQSACLQAMACAKAVILSQISGLWDGELLRDGETCRLVAPADSQALAEAVDSFLASPERAEAIGSCALAAVRSRASASIMADALQSKIEKLTG